MILLGVALAAAASDGQTMDKPQLLRLVTASLERYKDVAWGYEGWTRKGNGQKLDFFGRYSRDGVLRFRMEWTFERIEGSVPVEFNEVHGGNSREYWNFLKHGGRAGGAVNIDPPLWASAVLHDCSFERAFLLPQLQKLLDNRATHVTTTLTEGKTLVARVDYGVAGSGIQEFEIDLEKGCSVVRYLNNGADGKRLGGTSGIELKKFETNDGGLWLPIRATYESFLMFNPKANPPLALSGTAQLTEWYAVTGGAFRCPADLKESSFDPPLAPENDVFDRVGKRGQVGAVRQPTATQREAIIAREMDRLESEGRIGVNASEAPAGHWRLILLVLGGVLLGAAAVVYFRR